MRKKKAVEIIRKGTLVMFIEFKKDSYIDSREIGLLNKKLNKFKKVLFEYNFSESFV